MILLNNVCKKYEKFSINKIYLKIENGDFFALLGPNGAGKTTIIRMMTGLTPTTSGEIIINGIKVNRSNKKYLSEIGVMPQHINLEPELTAYENLKLHGMLFNMRNKDIKNKIENLLDFCDLSEKAHVKINELSGGMKRKLLLARAIMHNPKILLLDEPTVGLDVMYRKKVWQMIKELNKNGITILLTTHYLEEAEKLCRNFVLLNNGNLLFSGLKKDILKKYKNKSLEKLYIKINRDLK